MIPGNNRTYLDRQKRRQLKAHIKKVRSEVAKPKPVSLLVQEVNRLTKLDSSTVTPPLSIGYSGIEGIHTVAEILKMRFDSSLFLVEKLLVANSINVLAGSSESGKSTFAFQLCIAICCKDQIFLKYNINVLYNRVIYVATEDNAQQIKMRVEKQISLRKGNESLLENFAVIPYSENVLKQIRAALEKNKADLIVIDNYLDVFEGDSNNAMDTRKYLNKFLSIASQYGSTVLLLHHLKKNPRRGDKDALLGSQALEAKARHVLMLNKKSVDDAKRILSVSKSNFASEEEKKEADVLQFESKTLTFKLADSELDQKSCEKGRYNMTRELDGESASYMLEGKKGRKPKIPKSEHPKILELLKTKTQQEVADIYGVDKSTISRIKRLYD